MSRIRPASFRVTVPGLALLLALTTAGCSTMGKADSFLGLVTPYRIDIVQGNVVTSEQAALLKPGMSRSQVRDVLGSPMVADLFHGDRWDYIFTIRRPGTEPQRRSVVVLFDGEVVKSIEAPELPSEREFVASIATTKNVKVPVLELTEAQRKALPVPPRIEAPAAAAEPAGPVRTYPPLEPT
jgi:outer membrane protein assembly factor BamE